MPMKSNQGATYSPDFFKGISKWAKPSNTSNGNNVSWIYNGDKDIKTSVGQGMDGIILVCFKPPLNISCLYSILFDP